MNWRALFPVIIDMLTSCNCDQICEAAIRG